MLDTQKDLANQEDPEDGSEDGISGKRRDVVEACQGQVTGFQSAELRVHQQGDVAIALAMAKAMREVGHIKRVFWVRRGYCYG